MRKGVLYLLTALGMYRPATPIKSVLIDVGNRYGVGAYSVDKSIRDEIRRAGLHVTVREYIQMCLLSDIGLERLIEM